MIKFLIFLFLFFFVIYQVTKLLFRPLIFFSGNRRPGSQFGSEGPQRKEGDIHIDYVPKGRKETPRDAGEYVDFKEVD